MGAVDEVKTAEPGGIQADQPPRASMRYSPDWFGGSGGIERLILPGGNQSVEQVFPRVCNLGSVARHEVMQKPPRPWRRKLDAPCLVISELRPRQNIPGKKCLSSLGQRNGHV